MTAREMQYEFEMSIRQLGKAIDREWLSSEVEDYLNQAQEIFFLREYSEYDRTEAVKKDLSNLVQHYSSTSFTQDATNMPNGYYVSIPVTVLYVVSEWATYNSVFTKVKPITHDYYTINKDNPLKQPYSRLIWRVDINGKHELVTDGLYSLSEYFMRYIQQLPDIVISTNTSCVLNSITHSRIVDIAVSEALKDYQAGLLYNQKNNE